jgi:hypothetical protein
MKRGWRSFVNVARVAVLTGVIVIRERAFGQRIVVDIHRVWTAIITLIFNAAPVADLSASWSRHAVVGCWLELVDLAGAARDDERRRDGRGRRGRKRTQRRKTMRGRRR